MNIKQTRLNNNLTQQEVANFVGIPLRTYVRYENSEEYGDYLKRQLIIQKISELFEINETKGILSIDKIVKLLSNLFDSEYKNQIDFCYLFGSYAKEKATEKSDVDLCISTSLTGFKFMGLSEKVRETLHKNVDLVRVDMLSGNIELLNEIMKHGIKIYG